MKKILIILIIIIILGAVGYFFLKPYLSDDPIVVAPIPTGTSAPPLIPTSTIDPGLIPNFTITEEKIISVSEGPVLDYWINKADNSVHYIVEGGKIYRAVENQGPESISNLEFDDINQVLPSPSGEMIIVQFKGSSFRIFNVNSKSWRALPAGAMAAAWSPDSKEVAYLRDAPSGVYIFNISSGRYRRVSSLHSLGFRLDWKNPGEIYLFTGPTYKANSLILGLSTRWGTFRTIASEPGQTVKWSDDGLTGISYDSKNGLRLIDNQGRETRALVDITLPEKCVLDDAFLICAIPEPVKFSKFPDSYLQRKTYAVDSFIRYKLASVSRRGELVFDQRSETEKIDAWHLEKVGDVIYYINRYDNKVYNLGI